MSKFNFSNRFILGLSLAGSLTFFGCNDALQTESISELEQTTLDKENKGSQDFIQNQFIVVLKDGTFGQKLAKVAVAPTKNRATNLKNFETKQALLTEAVSKMVSEFGIDSKAIEFVYGDALLGFAGTFTDEQIKAIGSDARVDYVEQDQVMRISDGFTDGANGNVNQVSRTEAQSTPWGISRVGYGNYAGGARWAWVIDSGIDGNHSDLTVDTQFSRSFVSGYSGTQDGNGHGTHVAGTIAAKDNSFGVVGVAAGATLVSCRVFAGSTGSNSAVISAVNYVKANAYSDDVANMSLGGGTSTTLDNAVTSAANSGVYFALAAGNEAQNTNNVSPGRVNGSRIFTVSGMDINSRYYTSSNYANPPIDICAPGVSVYSTYTGGGYATLTGTSMATPHVAGALLINGGTYSTQGNVLNDPDGNADPILKK
ncbi:subtilisin-like serine protease [Bernardetia litoralis DSM 6794]|uniref:Subtilisin-like serine protease n=1 Tax=Bernardetia litoralis (strain ATCC 23117 / DSM 6794 / NBRC 15988 / NCIMB 1366 / Fx l1 / Sio-4) TaxID=880071 RepID=I4AQJ2_BERLS|nr:S8 family serine peptidase [Bernardetia litoralis]AFM06227.1 subtilisin-like serine protease [Bernardetia litoralis DSM 6794]